MFGVFLVEVYFAVDSSRAAITSVSEEGQNIASEEDQSAVSEEAPSITDNNNSNSNGVDDCSSEQASVTLSTSGGDHAGSVDPVTPYKMTGLQNFITIRCQLSERG